MVIVTEPPAGMEPFQVTVLAAVVATPDVAEAETRVKPAGRVSVNSLPALSSWMPGPALDSTTV